MVVSQGNTFPKQEKIPIWKTKHRYEIKVDLEEK
jgi:hypothetical protein